MTPTAPLQKISADARWGSGAVAVVLPFAGRVPLKDRAQVLAGGRAILGCEDGGPHRACRHAEREVAAEPPAGLNAFACSGGSPCHPLPDLVQTLLRPVERLGGTGSDGAAKRTELFADLLGKVIQLVPGLF